MKKRNIDRDRENYCQKSAGETCNNIILLKGNPSPSTLKDFNKKYITSNCNYYYNDKEHMCRNSLDIDKKSSPYSQGRHWEFSRCQDENERYLPSFISASRRIKFCKENIELAKRSAAITDEELKERERKIREKLYELLKNKYDNRVSDEDKEWLKSIERQDLALYREIDKIIREERGDPDMSSMRSRESSQSSASIETIPTPGGGRKRKSKSKKSKSKKSKSKKSKTRRKRR